MKKNIPKLSIAKLKQRLTHLRSERGVWENHWQEIADYILPRKNTITNKKSEGQKRTFQILDNTGIQANELLAGALHGLLTNPNSEWFELTTGDANLDEMDGVRLWLQKTTTKLHNILNNSNFQTEIHELYTDLCAFGTGCMLIEEDEKDIVRFGTKFLREYYIRENNLGFVAELYREWHWTAQQLVAEFGVDSMPKAVLDAHKKGDETKFCVTHAVYPKESIDAKVESKMEYVSQYALPEQDHEISVGEFKDFPYVVPRWTKAAGETYGRSPGMVALPEMKVLNKMNETMLIGAQKVVDPPLQVEDDGVILPLITRPGGLNFVRPGAEPIRPIFNDTRMDFGFQAMEDRRKRVKDAYFVDQLQLQTNGAVMTATEVLQRTEEKMRLLGPMLGRQQSELLRPMIDRLIRICFDRRILDVPPQELQGKEIVVKYSSLIAKSQRINDGQSIQRTIQTLAPFFQLDPTVGDNFNGDAAARVIARTFGFPQEIMNDKKDVAAKRKARADAQAAQQQQQQQAQQAQQVQNASTIMDTMQKAAKTDGAI